MAMPVLTLLVNAKVDITRTLLLAFKEVGDSIRSYMKSATEYAANVQMMEVAMNQVGLAAGVTSTEMKKQAVAIQDLGITTLDSYKSLTKFTQANLDATRVGELARVAQNTAVLANISSSEAFNRLTLGVQKSSVVILRTLGIIIDSKKALKDYAQATNQAVDALGGAGRQAAFLNAVLKEGERSASVYTASMQTAAKQVLSLTRYQDELKLSVGNNLLPVYSVLVEEFTKFIQVLIEVSKQYDINGQKSKGLAESVRSLVVPLRQAAEAVVRNGSVAGDTIKVVVGFSIYRVAAGYVKYFAGALTSLGTVLLGLSGSFAAASTASYFSWIVLGAKATRATSSIASAWFSLRSVFPLVSSYISAFLATTITMVVAWGGQLYVALTAASTYGFLGMSIGLGLAFGQLLTYWKENSPIFRAAIESTFAGLAVVFQMMVSFVIIVSRKMVDAWYYGLRMIGMTSKETYAQVLAESAKAIQQAGDDFELAKKLFAESATISDKNIVGTDPAVEAQKAIESSNKIAQISALIADQEAAQSASKEASLARIASLEKEGKTALAKELKKQQEKVDEIDNAYIRTLQTEKKLAEQQALFNAGTDEQRAAIIQTNTELTSRLHDYYRTKRKLEEQDLTGFTNQQKSVRAIHLKAINEGIADAEALKKANDAKMGSGGTQAFDNRVSEKTKEVNAALQEYTRIKANSVTVTNTQNAAAIAASAKEEAAAKKKLVILRAELSAMMDVSTAGVSGLNDVGRATEQTRAGYSRLLKSIEALQTSVSDAKEKLSITDEMIDGVQISEAFSQTSSHVAALADALEEVKQIKVDFQPFEDGSIHVNGVRRSAIEASADVIKLLESTRALSIGLERLADSAKSADEMSAAIKKIGEYSKAAGVDTSRLVTNLKLDSGVKALAEVSDKLGTLSTLAKTATDALSSLREVNKTNADQSKSSAEIIEKLGSTYSFFLGVLTFSKDMDPTEMLRKSSQEYISQLGKQVDEARRVSSTEINLAEDTANQKRELASQTYSDEATLTAAYKAIESERRDSVLKSAKTEFDTLADLRKAAFDKAKEYADKAKDLAKEQSDFQKGINQSLKDLERAGFDDQQMYAAKLGDVEELAAASKKAALSGNLDAAKKYNEERASILKTLAQEAASEGDLSKVETLKEELQSVADDQDSIYEKEKSAAVDAAAAQENQAKAMSERMDLLAKKITSLTGEKVTEIKVSLNEGSMQSTVTAIQAGLAKSPFVISVTKDDQGNTTMTGASQEVIESLQTKVTYAPDQASLQWAVAGAPAEAVKDEGPIYSDVRPSPESLKLLAESPAEAVSSQPPIVVPLTTNPSNVQDVADASSKVVPTPTVVPVQVAPSSLTDTKAVVREELASSSPIPVNVVISPESLSALVTTLADTVSNSPPSIVPLSVDGVSLNASLKEVASSLEVISVKVVPSPESLTESVLTVDRAFSEASSEVKIDLSKDSIKQVVENISAEVGSSPTLVNVGLDDTSLTDVVDRISQVLSAETFSINISPSSTSLDTFSSNFSSNPPFSVPVYPQVDLSFLPPFISDISSSLEPVTLTFTQDTASVDSLIANVKSSLSSLSPVTVSLAAEPSSVSGITDDVKPVIPLALKAETEEVDQVFDDVIKYARANPIPLPVSPVLPQTPIDSKGLTIPATVNPDLSSLADTISSKPPLPVPAYPELDFSSISSSLSSISSSLKPLTLTFIQDTASLESLVTNVKSSLSPVTVSLAAEPSSVSVITDAVKPVIPLALKAEPEEVDEVFEDVIKYARANPIPLPVSPVLPTTPIDSRGLTIPLPVSPVLPTTPIDSKGLSILAAVTPDFSSLAGTFSSLASNVLPTLTSDVEVVVVPDSVKEARKVMEQNSTAKIAHIIPQIDQPSAEAALKVIRDFRNEQIASIKPLVQPDSVTQARETLSALFKAAPAPVEPYVDLPSKELAEQVIEDFLKARKSPVEVHVATASVAKADEILTQVGKERYAGIAVSIDAQTITLAEEVIKANKEKFERLGSPTLPLNIVLDPASKTKAESESLEFLKSFAENQAYLGIHYSTSDIAAAEKALDTLAAERAAGVTPTVSAEEEAVAKRMLDDLATQRKVALLPATPQDELLVTQKLLESLSQARKLNVEPVVDEAALDRSRILIALSMKEQEYGVKPTVSPQALQAAKETVALHLKGQPTPVDFIPDFPLGYLQAVRKNLISKMAENPITARTILESPAVTDIARAGFVTSANFQKVLTPAGLTVIPPRDVLNPAAKANVTKQLAEVAQVPLTIVPPTQGDLSKVSGSPIPQVSVPLQVKFVEEAKVAEALSEVSEYAKANSPKVDLSIAPVGQVQLTESKGFVESFYTQNSPTIPTSLKPPTLDDLSAGVKGASEYFNDHPAQFDLQISQITPEQVQKSQAFLSEFSKAHPAFLITDLAPPDRKRVEDNLKIIEASLAASSVEVPVTPAPLNQDQMRGFQRSGEVLSQENPLAIPTSLKPPTLDDLSAGVKGASEYFNENPAQFDLQISQITPEQVEKSLDVLAEIAQANPATLVTDLAPLDQKRVEDNLKIIEASLAASSVEVPVNPVSKPISEDAASSLKTSVQDLSVEVPLTAVPNERSVDSSIESIGSKVRSSSVSSLITSVVDQSSLADAVQQITAAFSNIKATVSVAAKGGLLGAATGGFLSSLGVLGYADGGSPSASSPFSGGPLKGPGTETSDSILLLGSVGEYVVRAKAVRHYGADFLRHINNMNLPRYADGGSVSSFGSRVSPSSAVQALSSEGKALDSVEVNLNIGNEKVSLYGERKQARKMVEVLQGFKRS